MLWALIVSAAVLSAAGLGRAEGALVFERWSEQVFERAKRENRFVLLSLQSH
jgi:hypothetical protein